MEIFGLGRGNEMGEKPILLILYQENKLIIFNGWFQLPVRKLYTWRSSQGTVETSTRNQMDFNMIKLDSKMLLRSIKIMEMQI